MARALLERERELTALDALLHDSLTGQGRIAVISGEAGIGKTALVEYFLAQAQGTTLAPVRALWAGCEALFTPQPLGPLYDIAAQITSPLRALLDGAASRATLFAEFLEVLAQKPSVVVIEDIHWADEATLDLIKYLARRIHRLPALLVLTYRDDELVQEHPLRLTLGDLPARDVARLRLLPLSEGAVAALAQLAHRPLGRLYAITGGNPFFVAEALNYDAPGAPASVSDAVLARIRRRSPAAQRLIELVAVVPHRMERWLMTACGAEDERALDELLAAQMLRLEGQTVAFRHELARQAVEDALAPTRRQTLHARVLRALIERGVERTSLARLAHHAAQAEDDALTLRFATEAARQAAAQGAHREAAAHYATALRYAESMQPEQQAELLSALADENYITGHVEEAIAPCEAALTLWRALERPAMVGRALRRLSRLSWLLGRNAEAERYGQDAVATLEALEPSSELALSYGNLAHQGTRTPNNAATLLWGRRAIALAERLGDYETLSYALNSVGTVEIDRKDYAAGIARMERSLAIALEHGYEEHAARAYGNLAIVLVGIHAHEEAEQFLRDGVAYCSERDLDPWGHFLRWTQARLHLEQGNWDVAEADASAIVNIPWVAITNRIPALLVLGRLRARRGQAAATALLDEARDLARMIGERQRIEQVAAARAEWRWLQGDIEGCVAEAKVAYWEPFEIADYFYRNEVALWLWRGGALREPPPGTVEPYALEIAGDWRAAAEAWERRGCPWEQGLALLNGDETSQRAALAIFERLGATPAVEIARRRLREHGARGLPRGPRPQTRANPLGLTARELEVLPLLAGGLRNAEIAERLTTSSRTVEHHVAGVLMKLNARSRAEAVRRAYEMGLLPQAGATSDQDR